MVCLAVCLFSTAQAQTEQQPLFGQSDLDQMLAPVALYPDDLLSNVLTAATYPLEVVQADRYLKQNPNLQGNALADALNAQPWDGSVKSLAQFPAVLAMMDDELSWTEQLGNAFLSQPGDVMDTVQALRAKAAANGTLQSSSQEVVQSQNNDIMIVPATPDLVYVPYYDPGIVFGVWWWPAQPPLFWNPPLAYRPYNFGNIGSGGIAYGVAIPVNGAWFSRYRPNWGTHTISVGNPRRGGNTGTAPWHHDPAHRLGVAYRTVPSVNRAVQQANPPRATASQFIPRAPQVETYHPAAPAFVPQRVEAPHPVAVTVPVPEPHAAPAQHGEPSHGEPKQGEANHNNDTRK
ncbi:MAG: DUF3300 domain-containing protein [Burkholderiaceae bacterium]|nr:DUF3300 domain-containing protein [Burkholderiaceae bacterium]